MLMDKLNLLESDDLTLFEKAVLAKLASIDTYLSRISIRSQKIIDNQKKIQAILDCELDQKKEIKPLEIDGKELVSKVIPKIKTLYPEVDDEVIKKEVNEAIKLLANQRIT